MADRSGFRAAVVVFGDLGRSPRMVRHALSLARVADVDLIGLSGSELPAAVTAHPRIACHRYRTVSSAGILARLRAVVGFVFWLRPLLRSADLILVQNPPSLPPAIARMLSARRLRSAVVIDWHNFSAAMLALRFGSRHVAVRLLESMERIQARGADAHLCVSVAMGDELSRRWGVADALVFHDRPVRLEKPLDPAERIRVRRRLAGAGEDSAFELLVISPTSWGKDEDFRLVLDAAASLDRKLERGDAAVVIVVTGDGPGRREFEAAAAALALARVKLATAWISADDYPRHLSAADAGLCLHRSASGFDLPMKLADFLAAGVPAFVFRDGPCLAERFVSGEQGWMFDSSDDLAERLAAAARPGGREILDRRAIAIRARPADLWDDAWRRDVLPVMERLIARNPGLGA